MFAWKYVDRRYADDFERGVLRIGTLRSFADIEQLRADREEGRAGIRVGNLTTGAAGPTLIQKAALAGLIEIGPDQTISNIVFVRQHPNCYCFCMSHTRSVPPNARDIVEFIISDTDKLSKLIRDQLDHRATIWRTERVSYGPTVKDVSDGPFPASPFLKASSFAWENEIRFVAVPSGTESTPPHHSDLKVFYTDADPSIARLLSRQ